MISFYSTVILLLALQSAQPCNIVDDFGAQGDGLTLDDEPLTQALEACQIIVFPGPGRYLLSAFNVSSNQELVLESGSVLLASTLDILNWPLVQSYPSYEPGFPTVLNRLAPFIGAPNSTNVTIRGAGTIDGQGAAWWNWPDNHNGSSLPHGRPRLVEPTYCTDFTLQGVHVTNPPFWAVHPYSCVRVMLNDLTFSAPLGSPNTDGLDPDSCSNVVIRNFTCLQGGDDAIAIKSGRDQYGRDYGVPSQNILIEGATIGPSRGVNIGSEMSGGVYNVTVKNTVFKGSEFALRIKSARGRGGRVSGVTVEDCTLIGVTQAALAFNMDYGSNPPSPSSSPLTPHVGNVSFVRVNGTALGFAGWLRCLPEAPCFGIRLEDVNISLARRHSLMGVEVVGSHSSSSSSSRNNGGGAGGGGGSAGGGDDGGKGDGSSRGEEEGSSLKADSTKDLALSVQSVNGADDGEGERGWVCERVYGEAAGCVSPEAQCIHESLR
jgi:hypothetical protein